MSARVKGASSSKGSSAASAQAQAAAAQPAAPAAASSAAASASAATLQVFWDLAKEDASVRAQACQVLVQSLAAEQRAFVASGGPAKAKAAQAQAAQDKMDVDDEEGDDDDDHEADTPLPRTVLSPSLCPTLSYSLKRLTRGLASSRAGARQGFALALTEILAQFEVVKTEDLLNVVADQIKLSSKANKQVSRSLLLSAPHPFLSLFLPTSSSQYPGFYCSLATSTESHRWGCPSSFPFSSGRYCSVRAAYGR